jgi:hypothetical protein
VNPYSEDLQERFIKNRHNCTLGVARLRIYNRHIMDILVSRCYVTHQACHHCKSCTESTAQP